MTFFSKSTGAWVVSVIFLFFCSVSVSASSVLPGQDKDNLPYRPSWVSVVKKGKLFKYKRKEFSSPRLQGDLIFVGADSGYFYAMKKKNGRKVWRYKTEGSINSAPAFFKDNVLFGNDEGMLICLDAATGREVWKKPFDSEILTAPAVSGNHIFVATVEGDIVSIDGNSGEVLWKKSNRVEGFKMTIRGNSPPVVDDAGRLFVGFADGQFWALAQSDGKILWQKTFQGEKAGFFDVDAEPVIEGDRLYVSTFDGGLYALARKSGQILWSQPVGSGVRPVIGGEFLYVSGSDGHLYAFRKNSGEKVWDTRMGIGALTAPVYYKDRIVAGLSDATINFVRAEDGHVLARRFARKGIFSDPIIDSGDVERIYYFSNGGRLYSLKLLH